MSDWVVKSKFKIRKLFLGLNKVFFQKKKERYAARSRQFSPSLPGDRNRIFGPKSGHRAQISRNFVRYDALLMKSFCLLIRLTFAKAFS